MSRPHPPMATPRGATKQQASGFRSRSKAPLLRITPFIEQMGKPGLTRKEFWWEREWRHAGDLDLGLSDIVAVFVPEDGQPAVAADLVAAFEA